MSWMADAWSGYAAPAEFAPRATTPAAASPLPSHVVLALSGASLSTLGLLGLLVLGARPAAPTGGAPPSATAAVSPAASAADTPVATPETTFGDEPHAIPGDVIARLEAASNEPLHGELTQLLGAIQVGFGHESAALDPALRSYTVRMASRFEWNPDTFQVAVRAPSAELAEARAGTLRRIFGDAVASRRLQIESATGPDALTLASRPSDV